MICRNGEDITNYIDKVEQYELNPGNGDLSYLGNAYIYFSKDAESSLFSKKNDREWVCSPITQSHPNQRICIESNIQSSGKEIIQQINQQQNGLLDLHCHGGPEGIVIGQNHSPYHGINGLDSETGSFQPEDGNGLDNLNNFLYPNYSYSISCTTMPFDAPHISVGNYGNGADDVSKNFGESFTTGKHYGGIAFLGNTRRGYFGASGYYEAKFFEALNNHIFHSEIGRCESLTRSHAGSPWLSSDVTGRYIRLSHNLLGDPHIRIWKQEPKRDKIFSCIRNNDKIIISDSIVSYGSDKIYKIVAREPSGKLHIFNKTSDQTTLSNIPSNSFISIVGDNMLTLPADVELTNFRTSKSDYVYANNAILGAGYFNPNTHTGDLIFEGYGMTYTIDARDIVHLKGGLVVRDFATLRIITPSFVQLGDVTVSSGGKIEIYAKGYLHYREPRFLCDNAFSTYKYNKYNSNVKDTLDFSLMPIATTRLKAKKKYTPMFEIGKEWRYLLRWQPNASLPANKPDHIRILRVDGVKEMGGQQYYIVNAYTDDATTPDNNEPYGYFREDTDNRQIYFLVNQNYNPAPIQYHNIYDFINCDHEICLYDFNHDAAITRGYAPFNLSTPTGILDGFTYAFDTDIAESYVQGIGYLIIDSNKNPLPHETCDLLGRPPMSSGTHGYLPMLYSVVDGKGNEILNIEGNESIKQSFRQNHNNYTENTIVYSDGKINVTSSSEIGFIEILDMQGLPIYHHRFHETQVSIPTDIFPSGLYLVKAGHTTKTIYIK